MATPSQRNPDTPTSRYSTSINFEPRPFKAADIAEAVTNETMNGLTALDVDDFMKQFIPVDSVDVEAILGELSDTGYYIDNKWKLLPMKQTKNRKANETFTEQALYDGWIETANAINDIASKKYKTDIGGIEGKWLDCNHMVPKSQTPNPPSLRPDIAFVAVTAEKERLKEYAEDMHSYETRQKKKIRQQLQDDDAKRDMIISELWWLQMIGFGEFKVKTQDKEQAFIQLCTYVKQAFREQLDRRFIISFTLCYDDLNVYLFDRSGIASIETSINIHENPEYLIQFIAGHTILSSEKIGFDPTMKIYSRNMPDIHSENPQNSWAVRLPKLKDQPNLYKCQWIIEIDKIQYLTVRTLSLIGSEIMCGRATIVWEVIQFTDFQDENYSPEVFVLKQSWQRIPGSEPDEDLATTPFEYFAYKRVAGTARIQQAVYIQSEGQVVSTMGWIRNGLEGPFRPSKSLVTDPCQNPDEEPMEEAENPGELEPFQHQSSLDVFEQSESERLAKPVNRIQTRIVMKTRGRPLNHFRNLEELLQVFYGAVQDHKQFYDHGVLHRDISAGNVIILISPNGDQVGSLIDLDHAKVNRDVEKRRPLFDRLTEESIQTGSNGVQTYLTTTDKPVFVETETAKAAFEACRTRAAAYLQTVISRFNISSSRENPVTISELHWDLSVKDLPSFEAYLAGEGVRTGTVPYMSHEIVFPRFGVVHDAIHDMESFFWLMIHVCLTRSGPGTRNPSKSPRLHSILFEYYNQKNTGSLSHTKGQLFDADDKVAEGSMEILLKNFHGYFEGLKPLIREWRKLLQTAYQFRAYELWTIHDRTMSLIATELSRLPKDGQSISPDLAPPPISTPSSVLTPPPPVLTPSPALTPPPPISTPSSILTPPPPVSTPPPPSPPPIPTLTPAVRKQHGTRKRSRQETSTRAEQPKRKRRRTGQS